MIDWSEFFSAAAPVFTLAPMLAMILGVSFGVLVGALPGFNATLGMAIMLPVVFSLEPLTGLIFLLSIYTGGLYGGSITAILINVPGAPGSIAVSIGGHPMAMRGEAGRALGLAIGASAIGGFIGIAFLIIFIGPLAKVALRLGPLDLFMVAIFGLTVLAALRGASFIRTAYGGLLGLLVGSMGLSGAGQPRGTFGRPELLDGIPLIPAMVGLFAIPEIINLCKRTKMLDAEFIKASPRDVVRGVGEAIRYPIAIIRSSMIGIWIGAVPAAGASVASLLAYSEGKRWAKDKKDYEAGNAEAVVSAEASNNASEGGSLATALVLGVPGSSATAVLIGAFVLMGWQPGPRLIADNQEVIYGVLTADLLQEVLLLPIGIFFALLLGPLAHLRSSYLVPGIAVLCVVGALSMRGLTFDVWVMLLIGLVGYFLAREDIPPVAVLLGIILAPIADRELFRSVQLYGDELFANIFMRPVSLIMFVLVVGSLVAPVIRILRQRRESGRQLQTEKAE